MHFIVNLNLFHHLLFTVIVLFTKSMFAAIVYILLSGFDLYLQNKAKTTTLVHAVHHEAIYS